MDKLPKFTILALLAVITVGSVFALNFGGQRPKGAPQAQMVTSYTPRTAKADAPQETEAVDPDGKLTLTMRAVPAGRQEEKGKEASTFVFLISQKGSTAQKEIYREVAPVG